MASVISPYVQVMVEDDTKAATQAEQPAVLVVNGPKLLRVAFYRYRFTDFATRRATGAWWDRELLGYSRPLRASDLR